MDQTFSTMRESKVAIKKKPIGTQIFLIPPFPPLPLLPSPPSGKRGGRPDRCIFGSQVCFSTSADQHEYEGEWEKPALPNGRIGPTGMGRIPPSIIFCESADRSQRTFDFDFVRPFHCSQPKLGWVPSAPHQTCDLPLSPSLLASSLGENGAAGRVL